MAFVLFVLSHIVVLGILAATVWAAGRLASRPLRATADTPWPFVVAIGLALLAQLALLIGLVGGLRTPVVVTAIVLIHAAAIGEWRRAFSAAGSRLAGTHLQPSAIAWLALGAACALPLFLLALYPPLGFDQTMYHLPFARAFAASGGVPFLPALRYPIFPQLDEVLDAAVLLLAGDVATQLVGWLAFATGTGLAFVWARDLTAAHGEGTRDADDGVGFAGGCIAAAMLVGSPVAHHLAGSGYVEPMYSLLGLSSLYAADRVRRGTTSGLAWVAAAGALAGSAAGVKYLGLFFVPATAVLLLRRGPWRVILRDVVCYGVAAGVALAPSYGRIFAHTGSPVFPFYPELFGSSPWDAEEFLGTRGFSRLRFASTMLFDITFRRHLVGEVPHFSPAFTFALPIALLGAWYRPALRRLLAIGVAYVCLQPSFAHYFYGIAPLWSVVTGASVGTLVARRVVATRAALAAAVSVAVMLAMGGEAYAFYRFYRLGLPPATAAARARLITAQRPLYPAFVFLNQTQGAVTVYGIGSEHMSSYAAGTLLGDHFGRVSYKRVAARVRALGSVAAALDEIGAAYLLVAGRLEFWTAEVARDPRLERIYADDAATIYRVRPAR